MLKMASSPAGASGRAVVTSGRAVVTVTAAGQVKPAMVLGAEPQIQKPKRMDPGDAGRRAALT